tara:strand:+ start:1717 stop:2037 length:321 start_codon:yes stop_codon:yes gene_type:complete
MKEQFEKKWNNYLNEDIQETQIFQNLKNNEKAIEMGIKVNGDKIVIGNTLDQAYLATFDGAGGYSELMFSNPTGKVYFDSEEDMIAHINGDSNKGSRKPNPSNYSL